MGKKVVYEYVGQGAGDYDPYIAPRRPLPRRCPWFCSWIWGFLLAGLCCWGLVAGVVFLNGTLVVFWYRPMGPTKTTTTTWTSTTTSKTWTWTWTSTTWTTTTTTTGSSSTSTTSTSSTLSSTTTSTTWTKSTATSTTWTPYWVPV